MDLSFIDAKDIELLYRKKSPVLFHVIAMNQHIELFCVGDDWQSIYRFAGSKLDLFTSFRKILLNLHFFLCVFCSVHDGADLSVVGPITPKRRLTIETNSRYKTLQKQ